MFKKYRFSNTAVFIPKSKNGYISRLLYSKNVFKSWKKASVFRHLSKSLGNGRAVNDWSVILTKARQRLLIDKDMEALLSRTHVHAHMDALTDPEKYERNNRLTCQLQWQAMRSWTRRVTQSGDS